MGSFNWQDEETGWEVVEETPLQDSSPQNNNRTGRRWAWIAAALLIVAGLGVAAWWQIESTEDQLEEAVVESWTVIVASEKGQDIELLMNQLSGRDDRWIENQRQLLQMEKLTGRGSILPALTRVDTAENQMPPQVAFSPDLTQAVLTHEVSYTDGWGRQLILKQDEVFRLGSDRWLYSPPDTAYWGEGDVMAAPKYSTRFAYTAPNKDIGHVDTIVAWFENRLDALCIDGYFEACATLSTPQISLNFTPIINEELLAQSPNSFDPKQLQATFPAPSLLGVPATDEDMRLLAEAYGEQFFERYLIVLMNNRGVPVDPFLKAVNQYAITQVNGMAPLNLSTYQKVAESIEQIETAFNQNRVVGEDASSIRQFMDIPAKSTFRIMVQYRMQTPGLTPQQLIDRHLADENAPFFPEVLLTAAEWPDFRRFVESRASLANS